MKHLRLITVAKAQIDADEAATLIDQLLEGVGDLLALIPTLFIIRFEGKKAN